MVKRIQTWAVSAFILFAGIGWAAGELKLIAPGGGEMDMEKNVVKYYAAGTQLVEAHWEKYDLYTNYLEYYREQEVIKAKEKVKLIDNTQGKRVLYCDDLSLDVQKDFLVARANVLIELDVENSVSGGLLEWNRTADNLKLTEKPVIIDKGWKVTGKYLEGQPKKGLFTMNGPVDATNGEVVAKAGKMIYNQQTEQLFFKDNPVLVRGKSEMTATEIIYDLKTEKVSAKGMVNSKILKD